MSKKIDEKDIVSRLLSFGLTEKEARIYLALLPYRDIGTSKLVRSTGLHGQFVYNALASLEEKGLARHVVQNGRKKFSANTPTRLVSRIEERRLSVKSLARELQTRYTGGREQDIEIYQGESAFIAHQLDLLERTPEGGTIDVIASESERYMRTFDAEGTSHVYETVRERRKIRIRYIGSESQRTRLQSMEKERPLWTYRILPGQSTGVMNTDIWTHNVTMNIFGDPILSISITGKEIADGYRAFFETLWKLSSR